MWSLFHMRAGKAVFHHNEYVFAKSRRKKTTQVSLLGDAIANALASAAPQSKPMQA
jgi:hypothetical protein